jgi:hypothetical protein
MPYKKRKRTRGSVSEPFPEVRRESQAVTTGLTKVIPPSRLAPLTIDHGKRPSDSRTISRAKLIGYISATFLLLGGVSEVTKALDIKGLERFHNAADIILAIGYITGIKGAHSVIKYRIAAGDIQDVASKFTDRILPQDPKQLQQIENLYAVAQRFDLVPEELEQMVYRYNELSEAEKFRVAERDRLLAEGNNVARTFAVNQDPQGLAPAESSGLSSGLTHGLDSTLPISEWSQDDGPTKLNLKSMDSVGAIGIDLERLHDEDYYNSLFIETGEA